MSKRADNIIAAVKFEELWSARVEDAWRSVAFSHYPELVAALIASPPDQADAIVEAWCGQFVIPILEKNAKVMTEGEYKLASRIAGNT